MAIVTGLTAERMLEIEAASIVNGEIDGAGHLILTRQDASEIDAGYMLATMPDASETVEGAVELATNAEATTGTDATRVITPASLAVVFSNQLAPFDTRLDALEAVDTAYDTRLDVLEAATLDSLSNVTVPSPAIGDLLQWNGTAWVNATDIDLPETSNIDIGDSGSSAAFSVKRALITDYILSGRITGDGNSRVLLESDGRFTIGPGNIAPDTTLYRLAASIWGVDDDFAVALAGKGFRVKEGSNAKMGVSTLVAGTVVVSNTSVTSTSRIFLTCNTPGGTPGFLRVSARTAGTSFTILSSSGTDTSVVAWQIFEPA